MHLLRIITTHYNLIIKKTFSILGKFTILSKLLLLYIFIVVLPVFLLGYYSYSKFSASQMQEYYNTSTNTNELLCKNLEFHFDEMENICNLILYNVDLTSLLSLHGSESSTQPNNLYQSWSITSDTGIIENFLQSIMTVQSSCLDIGIYTFDGNIYHRSKYALSINEETKNNFRDSSWFKEVVSRDGKRLFLGTHTEMQVKNGEKVFSLAKLIKDPRYLSNIGVVLVDYDFKVFRDIYNMVNLNKDDNIIIADDAGNIVYEKNELNIGYQLQPQLRNPIYSQNKKFFLADFDNKKYFVTYSTDRITNWRFISVLSYEAMERKLNSVQNLIVYILFFSLMLISLIYYLLVRAIFKPIRILSQKMLAASKGDLTIRYEIYRNDEIGIIGKSFNILIASIKELLDKQLQSQTKIRTTEIQTLQAQINPHFMYNTLNTIKWMAIEIHAEKIKRTIESLVRLLKNTINKEGQFISLQKEMDNLFDFVYIQNMRYGDRFKFVVNIEDNTNDSLILKMLLQPLVENAIFHGFQDESFEECTISVHSFLQNNNLTIEISDNGSGMDKATLERVLSDRNNDSRRFSGIGLPNVLERIKLNFGEQYGLEIQSEVNKGTAIRLVLPYIRAMEAHEDA